MAPPGYGAEEGRRRRAGLVHDVRERRIVRRLDVWSVVKVSLLFYFFVFVVLVVAGTVLWNVAATFGLITSLDKLVRNLFALTAFTIHPLAALEWGSAVAGLVCLVGVLVNLIAALLYNLIGDVVGGIQVFVVRDEERRRAP